MKRIKIAAALLLSGLSTFAQADVSEQEAMEAQVSSALASADYAKAHCPNLKIDEDVLQSKLARIGKPADALRKTEDYAEQRDVLASMAKGKNAAMICIVLPSSHGGYGRGIITSK